MGTKVAHIACNAIVIKHKEYWLAHQLAAQVTGAVFAHSPPPGPSDSYPHAKPESWFHSVRWLLSPTIATLCFDKQLAASCMVNRSSLQLYGRHS
jgi:hypothetical protein